MIYLRFVFMFLTLAMLPSCNTIADNISWAGLIVLFVVLMALFGLMFYLIAKRRKQGDKSLVMFSASVQGMLDKLDSAEKKIKSLEVLIGRIREDEKYKKDTVWQDKVLAKIYLHLATQYHSLGDMKNTLFTCTKILELTPDDAMTLYNRGSIYSDMEEYEKALADFDRSIELVDDYGSSYNNRGMVLSKLGRQSESIADYNRALELEESAAIYYNRGNAYKEMGELANATADYDKGLQLCNEYDDELKNEIWHRRLGRSRKHL